MWRSHFVVLLLTVLHVPSVLSEWDHTVYVSVNGSDSAECMSSNSLDDPCATLTFVVDNLADSTRIVVLSGTHIVETKLSITGKQDITFVGFDGAKVLCVPKNETVGAGLSFVLLHNLNITGLTFANCGALAESTMHTMSKDSDDSILLFRTALCILNSTTVYIEGITISNSTGIGLSIFDTNGNVSINGSNFTNNSVPEYERERYYGGGGVYIELTYCSPGRVEPCDYRNNPYSNGSVYTIANGWFQDNQATTLTSTSVQPGKTQSQRLGKGAGLAITIKGSSSNNVFIVTQCKFINNSAVFGGGVDVQLQDFATYNNFSMTGCLLVENRAAIAGGGARLGIVFYESDCIYGNEFIYGGVGFIRNKAQWGGGMEHFASRTGMVDLARNMITFTSCNWIENKALLAAAVNLSPEVWSILSDGYLPVVTFTLCKFRLNGILEESDDTITKGILFSTEYEVRFKSSLIFDANGGTAILSNGGSINIMENTSALFLANNGLQGGAMALLGYAVLRAYPGSNISFVENTAVDEGGAIYAVSSDAIDFLYSRSCFLQYSNNTIIPDKWKTQFYFESNRANLRGHSIYATSLLPCSRSASFNGSETPDVRNVFKWKSFDFSNDTREFNIATDIANVEIGATDENGTLQVIPGENYDLLLSAYDDLGNEVQSVFKATTNSTKYHVQIDPAHQYISDGKIQVSGRIGANFPVDIHTIDRRRIGKSINITLISCSPGYVYSNNTCVCTADAIDYQLPGIAKCSPNFEGLLNKGLWAGCDKDGNLLTADCPPGYCSYDSTNKDPFIALGKNCSAIDKQLCGPNKRTGLLCGKCADNYTVFYHSSRFLCAECELGHLGWLFYILSELVPLTILFVIIVAFNIRLTSGAANGFILFGQAIDLLWVQSFQQFSIPPGVPQLDAIYRFFFGTFNLDFFKYEDSLSFCLWNNATVLDILVFKYVTSFYVIVLLGVLLLLFKIPQCGRCLCCVRKRAQQNWGVHGISAFLVLSYAQCAKVSFFILAQTNVYGYGKTVNHTVLFLMGETEFMHEYHLAYAIPAILIILLLAIPPLVLTAYPLVQRLVDRNKEGENVHALDCTCSKCSRTPRCTRIKRWLSIERFKPLIDSFQGCYKDKFRFFSGIFFMYRLGIAAALALTTSGIQLYVCMEVVLIFMLAMVAILQPYEKRFYNILDSLLFTDLAIFHGLSIFSYYCVECSQDDHDIATWFQIVLLYLPVLYPICLIAVKITARCNPRSRAWKALRMINDYVPIVEEVQSAEDIKGEFDDLSDRTQSGYRYGTID